MNFSNNPYYTKKTSVDDAMKAKIFTFDSKVFVRSLSDAIICTNQVVKINTNKELYLNKISILDKTLKNKYLLLAKYCNHDICNANIIASKSLTSYYNYFMMKYSVNMYLNFYDSLKEISDYETLSNQLDNINEILKNDLQLYVSHLKRKYFIFTKE